MNGTKGEPKIIECSRCGCDWNISINADIPDSGYICPHCTSRERENNTFQEDNNMANRALLHRSKVEDFKDWLQEDGWQIEPTKGIYEVVRATKGDRKPYTKRRNRAMMNKSKIEWTDFTWNPVTGCLHGCEYCYARKQTKRFSGDVRLNKSSDQLKKDENGLYILEEPFKNQVGKVTPDPVGFEPIMHKYRLAMPVQKKKPAKIFVCSMADLFGAWVPDSWIEEVFKACDAAPWHTYMFLTKNPRRYMELAEKGIIRTADNFWYGSTATTPETEFFWHDQLNTFVSIEPIHAPFPDATHPDSGIQKVKWVIIGAETGNHKGKVVPERDWICDIVKACWATKTPVFLKDSLEKIWGEDLIQEWPKGMPADKSNDVPHCKNCEHHTTTKEGKRGERHECEIGWEAAGYDDRGARHVTGRHARTSPPWCPKREED